MPSGQLPAVQSPVGIATAVASLPVLETLHASPGAPPIIPANPVFAEQAPAAPVIEHLFNPINDNIDVLGGTPPFVIDYHLG